MVEELDEPDDLGRTVRVTIDLQQTFALNQPLAPFALAALDLLDPESDTYALDIVSVIEAVLDDPRQILSAQLFKAKGEAVAAMKAEGMEYDERMAALDEITHPKPLAELLEPMFDVYRQRNPWVADHPLSPKSVARDLWERAMDFGDYVRFYNLARSEGTVLRYLSDAYKTLVRTIPEDAKTDELSTSPSGWASWSARSTPACSTSGRSCATRAPSRPSRGPAHRPARRRRSPPTAGRSRCWCATRCSSGSSSSAHRQWQRAGGARRRRRVDRRSAGSTPWRRTSRSTATIGIGPDARNPALLAGRRAPADTRLWTVRQILDDPAGDHDWRITAEVDLRATDDEGTAVIRILAVGETAVDA